MKTSHNSSAYLVVEKHPGTQIVGRALLCADCHTAYEPKDDEHTRSLALTYPDSCDQCGTRLAPPLTTRTMRKYAAR